MSAETLTRRIAEESITAAKQHSPVLSHRRSFIEGCWQVAVSVHPEIKEHRDLFNSLTKGGR